MTGELIKQFLVGLGFDVDEKDLAKFNKAVATATVRVVALYTSVNLMAGAIVKSISSISEDFEQMGYEYHLIAPAINKALVLRREMLKAYSAAGINIREVITNSIKLNFSLTKTKFALEAIYKSVGSKFFTLITKQSDIFRNNLYKNMPKIISALEKFVNFIFKAFEAVTTLGMRVWSILTRVYDFFVQLDKATDGWSTFVLELIAAWKLLNLEFFATPLGMLLAGFLAILALYDDFETFKEGGKSLFDWSSFIPVIDAVAESLKQIKVVVGDAFMVIFELTSAIIKLFSLDWSGFKFQIKNAFGDIAKYISDAIDGIKSFFNVGSSLVGWAEKVFGSGTNAPNVQLGTPLANPIGSNVNNANTNQNVNQQTQINVTGGANAESIGKSVAGHQGRVNQDLVRNMKGAVR